MCAAAITTTRKDICEFFRLALRLGLIPRSVVEQWVDSVIAADPVVNFPFTELAGASKIAQSKVDELLAEVPGQVEDHIPGTMVMALLRRLISEREITPENAAKYALLVGRSNALADSDYYEADRLEDSLTLATCGVYGTLEETRRGIVEFFERFSDFENHIPVIGKSTCEIDIVRGKSDSKFPNQC
jgi:hypothetical protein